LAQFQVNNNPPPSQGCCNDTVFGTFSPTTGGQCTGTIQFSRHLVSTSCGGVIEAPFNTFYHGVLIPFTSSVGNSLTVTALYIGLDGTPISHPIVPTCSNQSCTIDPSFLTPHPNNNIVKITFKPTTNPNEFAAILIGYFETDLCVDHPGTFPHLSFPYPCNPDWTKSCVIDATFTRTCICHPNKHGQTCDFSIQPNFLKTDLIPRLKYLNVEVAVHPFAHPAEAYNVHLFNAGGPIELRPGQFHLYEIVTNTDNSAPTQCSFAVANPIVSPPGPILVDILTNGLVNSLCQIGFVGKECLPLNSPPLILADSVPTTFTTPGSTFYFGQSVTIPTNKLPSTFWNADNSALVLMTDGVPVTPAIGSVATDLSFKLPTESFYNKRMFENDVPGRQFESKTQPKGLTTISLYDPSTQANYFLESVALMTPHEYYDQYLPPNSPFICYIRGVESFDFSKPLEEMCNCLKPSEQVPGSGTIVSNHDSDCYLQTEVKHKGDKYIGQRFHVDVFYAFPTVGIMIIQNEDGKNGVESEMQTLNVEEWNQIGKFRLVAQNHDMAPIILEPFFTDRRNSLFEYSFGLEIPPVTEGIYKNSNLPINPLYSIEMYDERNPAIGYTITESFRIVEPCYWTELTNYKLQCNGQFNNDEFTAVKSCMNPESHEIECSCRQGYHFEECRFHIELLTPPYHNGKYQNNTLVEINFEWIPSHTGTSNYPVSYLRFDHRVQAPVASIPSPLIWGVSLVSTQKLSDFFLISFIQDNPTPTYIYLSIDSSRYPSIAFDIPDSLPVLTNLEYVEAEHKLKCPYGANYPEVGCFCPTSFTTGPNCSWAVSFKMFQPGWETSASYTTPTLLNNWFFGSVSYFEIVQAPSPLLSSITNQPPPPAALPPLGDINFELEFAAPDGTTSIWKIPRVSSPGSLSFPAVPGVNDGSSTQLWLTHLSGGVVTRYPIGVAPMTLLSMQAFCVQTQTAYVSFDPLNPSVPICHCQLGHHGDTCQYTFKFEDYSISSGSSGQVVLKFENFSDDPLLHTVDTQYTWFLSKMSLPGQNNEEIPIVRDFVGDKFTALLTPTLTSTRMDYRLRVEYSTSGGPTNSILLPHLFVLEDIPTIEPIQFTIDRGSLLSALKPALLIDGNPSNGQSAPQFYVPAGSQTSFKVTLPMITDNNVPIRVKIQYHPIIAAGQWDPTPVTIYSKSYPQTGNTQQVEIVLPNLIAKMIIRVEIMTSNGPLTFISALFSTLPHCLTIPDDEIKIAVRANWISKCGDNGTCSSATGKCSCSTGYSGDVCQVQDKPCNQCNADHLQSCSPLNECICQSDWAGATCDVSKPCLATSNTQCTSPNGFLNPPVGNEKCGSTCKCLGQWIGSHCNICSLQCQNNGASYKNCDKCGCAAGFTGQYCQCFSSKGKITIFGYNPSIVEFQQYLSHQTQPISPENYPEHIIELTNIISYVENTIQSVSSKLLDFTSTSVGLVVNPIVSNDDDDITALSFVLRYGCDEFNPSVSSQTLVTERWNNLVSNLLLDENVKDLFIFPSDPQSPVISGDDLTPTDDTLPPGGQDEPNGVVNVTNAFAISIIFAALFVFF
jgi:hypothetical protein